MSSKESHRNQVPEAPGCTPTQAGLQPVYNERGVIAQSYYELQSLSVLASARAAYPLPKATGESTARAIFQAVEIALLNLADVLERAVADLQRGAVGPATVKVTWARGFHRVLVRLSLIPHQLGLMLTGEGDVGYLRVSESPAFHSFVQVLGRFDAAVLRCLTSGNIDKALAEESLDNTQYNLLHLARICNHESTIWEHNLAEVRVPSPVPSYDQFVVAAGMRDAVYDRALNGDTYFTQFRGLHQIPETLGEELNDHCEQAIRDIQSQRLREAVEHLRCVNILSEGLLVAVPPMADSLSTSDYHQIRENLGLTSGSHSVCLRFHMFTDLYSQLWDEIEAYLTDPRNGGPSEEAIEDAIRRVDRQRHEDAAAWLLHLLFNECLSLRAFIFQWRDQHLHLPRNNLGGEFTKSLTGSPDAITAVKKMRNAARASDPMLPLARARWLAGDHHETGDGPLAQYLESDSSLDSRILAATGHVTQHRFKNVQERMGFFANRCPFSPPPARRV